MNRLIAAQVLFGKCVDHRLLVLAPTMPLPAVVFNESLDLSARLAMHPGVSHCLSALVTGKLDAGQQAESLRIVERLVGPCTNM